MTLINILADGERLCIQKLGKITICVRLDSVGQVVLGFSGGCRQVLYLVLANEY